MKSTKTLFLAAMAIFLLSTIDVAAQKLELQPKWDKGLVLQNPDKTVKLKLGGRLQFQTGWHLQDETMDSVIGVADNGFEFRRLRLYNSGTIMNNMKYKFQLDFASGQMVVKDVFITITNIPGIGNFRAGHFKEPLGFEQLVSSNDITFIERASIVSLTPERNSGFMVFNQFADDRLNLAVGLFKDSDKQGVAIGPDNFHITSRISGLPILDEENQSLVHVGFVHRYTQPTGNAVSYKSRPESHLAPTYVATGTIDSVDVQNTYAVELAAVYKAFSIQGEYMMLAADRNSEVNDQSVFSGYYVQLSYFLTGESRPYSKSSAYFKRPSPKASFGDEGGKGAWELALRYSNLDLTDGRDGFEQMNTITGALNWYINPVSRIGLNYSYTDLGDMGTASIIQSKFQVSF